MPSRLVNEISDQSKALSLEFANSAFGLKQCKFVLSGMLLSPRLVTKDFVKSLKGIPPAYIQSKEKEMLLWKKRSDLTIFSD